MRIIFCKAYDMRVIFILQVDYNICFGIYDITMKLIKNITTKLAKNISK